MNTFLDLLLDTLHLNRKVVVHTFIILGEYDPSFHIQLEYQVPCRGLEYSCERYLVALGCTCDY